MTLIATRLPQGVHTYVYYARATTPGDFFVAPAHAQETYFREVFGRGDSSRFTVDEASSYVLTTTSNELVGLTSEK